MSQVVLVHGIWVNGLEMQLLGQRLRRCGFTPRRFPYADLRRSPAENAQRLQQWLEQLPGVEVHFVGHSLGGILLLHLFALFPEQRSGRVVLLGTPAAGSGVARRMQHRPLLRPLLGKTVEAGLVGGAPPWSGEHDLGIVAGTVGLGVGLLFGGLERPHDGTVTLAETEVQGARERITVAVTHTGMLFSSTAARQVCSFLSSGHFVRDRG